MRDRRAPVIVWFRDDLRLADNPALVAAAQSGRALLCVFVHEEAGSPRRALGGAARWWLHGALAALDEALRRRGGRLVLLRGTTAGLQTLVRETKAAAVYWNRRYDGAGRAIDAALKTVLQQQGVEAHSFNGHLLHEPWTVSNRSGAPFRVFTAYWRAAQQSGEPAPPLPVPEKWSFYAVPVGIAEPVVLAELGLEPTRPDWAGGLRAAWRRGEEGATEYLDRFLAAGLDGYADRRDRPDQTGTARLSPYLRFGNLSVRQVWHAAMARRLSASVGEPDLQKFLAELGWREFCYHLFFHHPDLAGRNFQPHFDAMPWRHDPAGLRAWQRGLTGYPIVDAGMRELWATGWMHNRVRMIAASFLTKHLLIDWREGEAWFWDTLVDADPASNAANWQWVAGSGADAAPFFRIFNPVLQGEKFDPEGAYVRHWVPELAGLPAALIHRPWSASPAQCAAAGLRLGADYPLPMVDHDFVRRRALAAWQRLKTAS